MRIRPEHLDKELNKALLPVYLVSGDEPLLVQETLAQIRNKARQLGFEERKVLNVDRSFDWNTLLDEANSLSLFASKKITEIKLGKFKPGAPGSKVLQAYCDNPPEDDLLIIEASKFDAATLKSKWAAAIDKRGAIIQVWPVNLDEMPRWISRRAGLLKLELSREAIDLLADRLEGNLLAASQELEKLKLLHANETISAEQVIDSVGDAAKYDIFDLTDACLNGQAKQASKIISHMRTEGLEVSIALWALSKELRLLSALSLAKKRGSPEQSVFKQYRVIPKRQQTLSRAASRLSPARLNQLLGQCKEVDDLIKGVKKGVQAWDALQDVALALSGVKRHPHYWPAGI